jgi:hypothetical protein
MPRHFEGNNLFLIVFIIIAADVIVATILLLLHIQPVILKCSNLGSMTLKRITFTENDIS